VRILAVSDLYPPLTLGGYEVAAAEVADALREKGHEVEVLATDWGVSETTTDPPYVRRALHSRRRAGGPMWRVRLAEWERDDRRAMREALARARPEVILLWNVGGVAHAALTLLLNGSVPAVVYAFGDWPLRKHRAPHDLDPWTGQFAPRPEYMVRRALRGAAAAAATLGGAPARAEPLRFTHIAFGSRHLQDRFHAGGLVADRSERVIYYGLFGAFATMAAEVRAQRHPGPPRLLFVGRIWDAKGLHTLIEAFPRLDAPGATLTVVGPEEDTAYVARLRRTAAELGVGDRIAWSGAVPRDALPNVYARHDVVVFPSTYEEPFGIVQLEAMAAGCAVVGTGTGGSAEILEPDRNALRFAPGDAESLAEQLRRLHADPGLAARLGVAGKETVRRRFLGTRMAEEMTAYLGAVASGVNA